MRTFLAGPTADCFRHYPGTVTTVGRRTARGVALTLMAQYAPGNIRQSW